MQKEEKPLARGSWGFSGGLHGKESTCNTGDPGLIPELGRSPGEGNGSPLQHSCLGNFTERGAWQAPVHGVAKLAMTERLILSGDPDFQHPPCCAYVGWLVDFSVLLHP